MLEINPLSIASFANILWVVVLFTISCTVQKLLRLIISHLLISVFIFIKRWMKKDPAVSYVRVCPAYILLCVLQDVSYV